ncbi:MAG: hypothetical protein H6Q30_2143 [Bacteroidetes bacterium]|jgi:hypothetical protein|nr:hypothetical protein [Bacteroidota bacterium]
MNRLGYYLLSICAGLVAGLLLGYVFFHDSGTQPVAEPREWADTSGTHQYFYRLNDTLVARHTISSSDTGVVHSVDTVAINIR